MNNLSSQKNNKSARNQMLALYDTAPYTEVWKGSLQQNTPLLINWINAACSQNHLAIGPNSNILVAGCGAGAEVVIIAQSLPNAKVVGIDFSGKSINKANEIKQKNDLRNVTFEVADLMSSEWCEKYQAFDFILCRGVADYVLDPSILMQTFSACLSDNGVICMMMNTPHHPARRIRDAFLKLGILPHEYIDTPAQRTILQCIYGLMGNDANIKGMENAPLAYLKVEIFPAIAHHDSMEKWCERANNSGLCFAGSLDSPASLLNMPDEQLPLFYKFGKISLSLLMANLNHLPGMQLLFCREKLAEPDFNNLDTFWEWKPLIDESLGNLPELEGDPNQPRKLSLSFPGFPDFAINCTSYDLEVLRQCQGQYSLGEIRNNIPVIGNEKSLLACMFRAYHYGLLS